MRLEISTQSMMRSKTSDNFKTLEKILTRIQTKSPTCGKPEKIISNFEMWAQLE